MNAALNDVTPSPAALNTSHAREKLRMRYPAPEWALLEEVAPSTGGATRYADAIAVNLWRSRGYAVHGFEIKVSRSDWLRELKQPDKAESLYAYCDHWWIVAPAALIKPGELPATWGHLDLRASGLVQLVAAPRLTPQPITRAFFASLMRRGHESISSVAQRMHHIEIAEARAAIDKRVEHEIQLRSRKLAELQERIAEFEKQTGLTLSGYSGFPAAQTIKLARRIEGLQSWGGAHALSRLSELEKDLLKAANIVREAIDSTDLIEPPPAEETQS